MIDAILKELMSIWTTLRAMNFYLEITIAAFAAYFWGRVSKMDNRVAVTLPIIICFLGQLAYGLKYAADQKMPFDLDDWIMAFFWTFLQSGLSFMVYTVIEKYGIIDSLGLRLKKEVEKGGASNAQTPPAV